MMVKIQNLKNINGRYIYQDFDARTVYQSAQDALDVAKAVGFPITMAFNAAQVKVTGNEASSKDVSDAYFVEFERQQREYRNSPEGIQQAAREAAQQARRQKTINTLVDGKLDDAITHGVAGILGWMAEYARHADNKNINGRYSDVVQKLKAAGYQTDACVEDVKVEKDLRTKGLYIIGQCLSCMEEDMPPHSGLAADYIVEYNELRKTVFIPVMHPLTVNVRPLPPVETIQLVQKLKLKAPQS